MTDERERTSDERRIDDAVDRAVGAASGAQPSGELPLSMSGPKLSLAVVFTGTPENKVLGLVEREDEGRAVAEAWWRVTIQQASDPPTGRVVIVPVIDKEPKLDAPFLNFDGKAWCKGASYEECEGCDEPPDAGDLRDRTEGLLDLD